jgi:hypothetical protein
MEPRARCDNVHTLPLGDIVSLLRTSSATGLISPGGATAADNQAAIGTGGSKGWRLH